MIIPEEILQTLLCSECHLYLNIPPIKVYYNRQIKCGRCSTNDQYGVVSKHYEMLMQNFESPCVNRYEGCEHTLTYKEVKEHEKQCIPQTHSSMFCYKFEGSAYNLRRHLFECHSEDALKNMEFFVNLEENRGYQKAWFCHENDNIILMLNFVYWPASNKLCITLDVVGYRNVKILKKFTLLNVQNDVKKTITDDHTSVSIDIEVDPKEYPKSFLICKLNLEKTTKVVPFPYCKPIIIPDSYITSVNVRFQFDNITGCLSYDPIYHKQSFFVDSVEWKVMIHKSKNRKYLGVYVECQNTYNLTHYALIKLSLISINPKKTISNFFVGDRCCIEEVLKIGKGLIPWEDVLNQNNGYLHTNNSIYIDCVVKHTLRYPDLFNPSTLGI